MTSKYIFSKLSFVYKSALRPGKDLYKRYGGGWAFITGGAAGIGQGFAMNLAKMGFDIVILD